ncbi:helix-turn-helix domain-containing protein [Micromonospora chalcea]|uniref:helix-turn-helix domain-containing protein n=1 Tax=Micromonospora chalcea TaxID=1874 RepID=UPI003796F1CD
MGRQVERYHEAFERGREQLDLDDRRRTLGREVRNRRRAVGLTIDRAAKRAPMSPETWRKVEIGERAKAFSYAGIERVLRWPTGTIEGFIEEGRDLPDPLTTSGSYAASTPVRPLVDVDFLLNLDRPDAVKVLLIKAVRAGGDPIDAVLATDAPDPEKVAAIRTLRELQGGPEESEGTTDPPDQRARPA